MICSGVCICIRADGILGCGIKCVCLENRSVTTHITVFPDLSGSSTIKSIEISFQGAWGFATSCRRTGVFPGHPLAKEQMGQLVT